MPVVGRPVSRPAVVSAEPSVAAGVGVVPEPSFDISAVRLAEKPGFFAAGAEPLPALLPTGSVPPPPVIDVHAPSSTLTIASFTPDQ